MRYLKEFLRFLTSPPIQIAALSNWTVLFQWAFLIEMRHHFKWMKTA